MLVFDLVFLIGESIITCMESTSSSSGAMERRMDRLVVVVLLLAPPVAVLVLVVVFRREKERQLLIIMLLASSRLGWKVTLLFELLLLLSGLRVESTSAEVLAAPADFRRMESGMGGGSM